jgi:hypothetical protein
MSIKGGSEMQHNLKSIPITLAKIACTIIFLSLFVGCTSIGSATVELSKETTVRIKDLHQVHQEAINQYFDFQETRVEEFIEREWTPLFLKNFLGKSNVIGDIIAVSRISNKTRLEINIAIKIYLSDASESDELTQELIDALSVGRSSERDVTNRILNKYVDDEELPGALSHVMALLGTDEPAIIIMEFAEAAHVQILKQRALMLAPIKFKRKEILISINDRYDEVLAAQGIITGRLDAANKQNQAASSLVDSVFGEGTDQEIRKELLGFGENVSNVLTELDSVLSDSSSDDQSELNKQLIDVIKSGMAPKAEVN